MAQLFSLGVICMAATKLTVHLLLLITASYFILACQPPFPVIGLLLCGISVFAHRWTSFYYFLNLFIIIAFIIYALYVDPSWLFSQHPSRWFFTVIAVQGWWVFTRYRSEREIESSHDDA